MEKSGKWHFSLLYCATSKLFTVALQSNCKTDVGEKCNIIILKSHLPTFLFMHGTFHAWCDEHEPVCSGAQPVGNWVSLSCVYLRHKRTNTRAGVTQLLSTESTGCLLGCCLTTDVEIQVCGRPGDRQSLQSYPGLLVPIPFSTTISTSIISHSFSLQK